MTFVDRGFATRAHPTTPRLVRRPPSVTAARVRTRRVPGEPVRPQSESRVGRRAAMPPQTTRTRGMTKILASRGCARRRSRLRRVPGEPARLLGLPHRAAAAAPQGVGAGTRSPLHPQGSSYGSAKESDSSGPRGHLRRRRKSDPSSSPPSSSSSSSSSEDPREKRRRRSRERKTAAPATSGARLSEQPTCEMPPFPQVATLPLR